MRAYLTTKRLTAIGARLVQVAILGVAGTLPGVAWCETKPAFELMHLWVAPMEQPALSVLKNAVTRAKIPWREHRVADNFYGIHRELAERLALNLPPTAVFWIGAADPNTLQAGNIFRPIAKELTEPDLQAALLPEIARESVGPHGLSALPLIIHLQNVAIVNSAAFERVGVPYPKSWAEFLEAAPKIKATGVTPLAVSGQRWLFRFLFSSILADGLSPEEFTNFLDGRMPRGDFLSIAKKAFGRLQALRAYANADYDRIDWSDAVEKVTGGEVAITITGDFAAPAIAEKHKCRLAPGNDFVMWSFDVLAFPVVPERERPLQEAAIGALATRDTLVRFGIAKGGIPVISNVSPTSLDACSRSSHENWHARGKVLLHYDKWRLSLNATSSLAQYVWSTQPTDINLDLVAERLFDEIVGQTK